jgi:hypothetical protein
VKFMFNLLCDGDIPGNAINLLLTYAAADSLLAPSFIVEIDISIGRTVAFEYQIFSDREGYCQD